jgi:hypothetical protein
VLWRELFDPEAVDEPCVAIDTPHAMRATTAAAVTPTAMWRHRTPWRLVPTASAIPRGVVAASTWVGGAAGSVGWVIVGVAGVVAASTWVGGAAGSVGWVIVGVAGVVAASTWVGGAAGSVGWVIVGVAAVVAVSTWVGSAAPPSAVGMAGIVGTGSGGSSSSGSSVAGSGSPGTGAGRGRRGTGRTARGLGTPTPDWRARSTASARACRARSGTASPVSARRAPAWPSGCRWASLRWCLTPPPASARRQRHPHG